MSFRASKFLQAPGLRSDINASLAKVWKSYKYNDGMVSQHLSPFEQQAIVPWIRQWPQRLATKFGQTWSDWVPAGLLLYGIVAWSESKHKELAHHHRS